MKKNLSKILIKETYKTFHKSWYTKNLKYNFISLTSCYKQSKVNIKVSYYVTIKLFYVFDKAVTYLFLTCF